MVVTVTAAFGAQGCDEFDFVRDCGPYIDEVGDARNVQIRIENRHSLPVYFGVPPGGGGLSFAVRDEQDEVVNEQVPCGESCGDIVRDADCEPPSPACDDCDEANFFMIPPGGAFEFAWFPTEWQWVEMPGECVGFEERNVPCTQWKPPDPGTYRLEFSFLRGTTCWSSEVNGPAPCTCEVPASGFCEVSRVESIGEAQTVSVTVELPGSDEPIVVPVE